MLYPNLWMKSINQSENVFINQATIQTCWCPKGGQMHLKFKWTLTITERIPIFIIYIVSMDRVDKII